MPSGIKAGRGRRCLRPGHHRTSPADILDRHGRQAVERVRRLLPSARVEVLAGCGHIVTADQPAAVAPLLADFLTRAPQEAASST